MAIKKRGQKAPLALSPARRRAFFLFTLVFPILLLAPFECTLRFINYGPDISLVTTETINGKVFSVMNPGVKCRYFSRVQFSPNSSPDLFLVPKPANTYRIFCLGGSTTVGYPYWYNGSFSGFLRDRLRRTFPDKSIEVINMGMTATNSFTVLDMAKDLVSYEPDLFIVYDGHNEFYGALGAASNESVSGSRWVTELYLRLIHLKTFMMLRDTYAWVASRFSAQSTADDGGTMMERLAIGQYVRTGSRRYENALRTFEQNLADLAGLCAEHHIPLLLSTQVSNIRDRPPFISSNELRGDQKQWDAIMADLRTASTLRLQGKIDSALGVLRETLRLDSLFAETHFLIGQCLDTLGESHGALHEYLKARDDDELRFRCSTDFNEAILHMDNGSDIAAIDMERVFEGASPDSLIGSNLIFEHLHPNSRGYFLIGKAYASMMRARGWLASPAEWAAHDTIPDSTLWNDRCVTDLDEMTARRRTEVLTSGWPFIDQYPTVDAIPQGDTLAQIMDNMTRGRWNWLRGHEAAALYYAGRKEFGQACAELRSVALTFQRDPEAYKRWARFALRAGASSEAREALTLCRTNSPDAESTKMLADLMLADGKYENAERLYQSALDFAPSLGMQVQVHYARALAFLKLRRGSDCMEELHKVLALEPHHREANALLSQLQHLERPQP